MPKYFTLILFLIFFKVKRTRNSQTHVFFQEMIQNSFVDTHITNTKDGIGVTEDEPVTTAPNNIEIRCTMQPSTINLEKPCSITFNDLSKTLPREVR